MICPWLAAAWALAAFVASYRSGRLIRSQHVQHIRPQYGSALALPHDPSLHLAFITPPVGSNEDLESMLTQSHQ